MRESASLQANDGGVLAMRVATALRAGREEIVRRWLERITARVTLRPETIFPTEELLNHVPLLVDGIADYIENPADALTSDATVMAKAMELGALRHEQGFDAPEILKEHEILAGVLFSFLEAEIERDSRSVDAAELARCWPRVAAAIDFIRQATVAHFLRLAGERVQEREARLRRFNRMVSHELKNRVGAIGGAAALLEEPFLAEGDRPRFVRIVSENAAGLQRVLRDLEALSRLEADARQRRNVLLPQAAEEAARQLRDAAQQRGVRIEIADEFPAVEVDAAAVELCLVNFISNGIKYRDPQREDAWVRVEGELRLLADPSRGELHVRVADNGLGVPEASRSRLFHQFFRAHAETISGVEGSGLGLSIVRETVESLGGRVWAEFPPEGGSVFSFSLPSRRVADAAAAGTRREDVAG